MHKAIGDHFAGKTTRLLSFFYDLFMKTSQSYDMNNKSRQSYGTGFHQINLYLKIAAGVIQIAIVIAMIMDSIEVREINRFKYYAGEPYSLSEQKDWYLNKKLMDMNTRLGLLVTIIVLVCVKQPVFWLGVIQNHFIALIVSVVVDLICFVLYVVLLSAFHSSQSQFQQARDSYRESFTAEAACGLVFSLLSCGVTGLLSVRVKQGDDYD